MSKKSLFAIIGIAVVGAGSFGLYKYFSGSSKHLQLMPKNAAMVFTVDFKSLADKAEVNGRLKETKLFKKMMNEAGKNKKDSTSLAWKKILENPLSSGINVFSNAYFFMQTDSNENYMGIIADVKDEENLAKTIATFPEYKNKIKSAEGFKYVGGGSEFMPNVIAWNGKGLIYLIRISGGSMFDENAPKSLPMEKIVAKYMNRKKDESILALNEFNQFLETKNDVGVFLNYNEYTKLSSKNMGMLGGGGMASLMNLMGKVYKDVYAGFGLNFEKNKIVTSGGIFGDAKQIERINVLNNSGINDNNLNYITNSGKTYGAMGVNLNIGKLLSIFTEEPQIKQNIEQTAQSLGMTAKDLETIFSGEISLAMTDISSKEIPYIDFKLDEATGEYLQVPSIKNSMMPTLTLNVGINNKANFNKLIAAAPYPIVNGVRKVEIPGFGMPLYAAEHDKGIFLSNDSIAAYNIATNKKLAQRPNTEVSSLLKDKPSSMFFDLNLNNYPAIVSQTMQENMGDKDFTYFKNYMAIFKDLKGSGNMQNATYEINLTEGDGNALYRLIKQIDLLPMD